MFWKNFNDTVKYRIEFLKSWEKTVDTFESLQENAQNLKNDYFCIVKHTFKLSI